MGGAIGGGKSGGNSSSAPVVTQEQKDALKAQTNFLTQTAMPAYQQTLGMANDVYGQTAPAVNQAAQNASNVAGQTGALQQAAGAAGTGLGMAGLASLFGPQYEQNQINAAMQAGNESAREAYGQNNAAMGAAGQLGSSRAALASQNLGSLNAQRQATAAAGAQAGVQANKAAAANQLATLGGQQLQGANQAASAQVGYAGTPQDVLAKYASVIYGTPQGSTTPNFAGTQGSNTSGNSKSGGFSLSDMNTKQDIQKIGVLDNGINIYKYMYKPEFRDQWGHDMQMGVLAQEVEQIMPEAVVMLDNGFKAVNYSLVLQ